MMLFITETELCNCDNITAPHVACSLTNRLSVPSLRFERVGHISSLPVGRKGNSGLRPCICKIRLPRRLVPYGFGSVRLTAHCRVSYERSVVEGSWGKQNAGVIRQTELNWPDLLSHCSFFLPHHISWLSFSDRKWKERNGERKREARKQELCALLPEKNSESYGVIFRGYWRFLPPPSLSLYFPII